VFRSWGWFTRPRWHAIRGVVRAHVAVEDSVRDRQRKTASEYVSLVQCPAAGLAAHPICFACDERILTKSFAMPAG
jgi:hypothetical protein